MTKEDELQIPKNLRAQQTFMRLEAEIALNSDAEVVWRRISDLAAIPTYWSTIKSIQILNTNGEDSQAHIEFAFGSGSEARIFVDAPDKTLIIYYASGALTGTQRVTVTSNRIVVEMVVKFHGPYKFFSPWENGRLRAETREALEKLVAPESDGR